MESDRQRIRDLEQQMQTLQALIKTLDSEVRHLMAKDQAPMKAQPDSGGVLGWRRHVNAAKQEAEWPQVGDAIWWINTRGHVMAGSWDGYDLESDVRNFLGIYKTQQAAEEAAAKIMKVMDHWRNGYTVHLYDENPYNPGEKIKL